MHVEAIFFLSQDFYYKYFRISS